MFLITKTISHQPHYFRSSQNHFLSCSNCFPSQKLVIQIAKIISLFLKELSQMKKKCHHSRANQNIEYKSRMPSLLPLCILVIFVAVPSTTAPGTCKIYHPNLRKIAFGRSALILVIPSTEGFFRRGAQGEFVEAHQRGGRGRKGQGAQKKWARHLCRRWFH